MKPVSFPIPPAAAALACALAIVTFPPLLPSARGAILYDWNASSGLYPDQVATTTNFGAVTLTDSSAANNPVLSGGMLRLADNSNGENMYYSIPLAAAGNGASLGPLPLTIEFTMRTISSSSSSSARGGSGIGFPVGNTVGNGLQIANSSIFLSSATFQAGSSAAVDTTNAFHSYRIEIGGYTAGSSVSVYFDNALAVTGSLYSSASDNGSNSNILVYFGEASSLAYSTTDWQSFRIYTVPEPSAVALAALGGACLLGGTARRRWRRSRVG